MKNKGFTLVEMLAAIVILSILIAIIVINFSNIFSSTQDKVYKTYETSMKDATIEYIIDSGEMPTRTTPMTISLKYLVGDEARVNPKTGMAEKAKPAYLDHFHNPRSSDDCSTSSYVEVSYDDSRERTDSEGHTDNNKNFKYKVCLICTTDYRSEGCN